MQPQSREPVTIPVWVVFGFFLLLLLCVGSFVVDPFEVLHELTKFREWEHRAQQIMLAAVFLPGFAMVLLLIKRVQLVGPGGSSWSPPPRRKLGERVSLGVFMGSGGHTAEMRQLLKSVDRKRYSPRVYVYCNGDEMSLRAVAEIEGVEEKGERKGGGYSLVALPRAREVGQGRISTLVSATKTALHAFFHTFLLPLADAPLRPWVDVLIVNGPGTAVVLVGVAYIRRVLGLSHTRIVYVESFARVNSLSLSGKILRSLVDKFVIQWPDAGGNELTPVDEDAVEERKGVNDEPTQDELKRVFEEKESGTVYRGWLV